MPRKAIAWLYAYLVFFKNVPNSIILQSHQQCMRVLFSSYPPQHLSFEYLILVILMDVK